MKTFQNIIIIGASSGIGRQLALQYGKNPHIRLGLAARRTEFLADIAAQIPSQCEIAMLDIAAADRAKQYTDLLSKFDRVDLIVYCAGYGEINPGLDWQLCNETLTVNVSGFTEIINLSYRKLAAQPQGTLAAVASAGGLRGFEDDSGYSASKAYQINYLEGLSRKSRRQNPGIKIATILPGFVDTAMAKGGKYFWMCSAATAARCIIEGLSHNRRYLYVTGRWRLVGWLLRLLPWPVFERL